MATRPRNPTFRTQPSLRPVYQNVQPMSEMKEDQEAYLLNIYLPGFTKEQIRITFVGSSKMVRVEGERPTEGGSRRIRFKQTYPVPENCDVERIQGKFDQGILTVTMPKKFISQLTPPKAEEAKTTQEKGPSPSGKAMAEVELKPEKGQEEKSASLPSPVKGPADLKEQKGAQKDTPPAKRHMESQKPAGKKELRALTPLEPVREPRPQTLQKAPEEQTVKPQKGQEEFEPKPTLRIAPKGKTGEKAQTGREGIDPKPISTMDPGKETDEKLGEEARRKTILATVKKQLGEETVENRAEDAEKERVTEKEVKEADHGKPSESRKSDGKDTEKGIIKEKEIKARKVSPKAAEPSAPKAAGKEKETSRRTSPREEKKGKEDIIGTVGKGIREMASSASEVVTRIVEGKLNDEEKPLVANMGAAVLVIAALGAYLSYKFASSERT